MNQREQRASRFALDLCRFVQLSKPDQQTVADCAEIVYRWEHGKGDQVVSSAEYVAALRAIAGVMGRQAAEADRA